MEREETEASARRVSDMAAQKKWTPEMIAEIEKLSFTMTRKQIAEKLGVSFPQIRYVVRSLKAKGQWKGSGYVTTRKTNRVEFKGCNEDCERCPYPDCLRPDNMV